MTTGVDSIVNVGSQHTLLCSMSMIPNLVVQPTIEWLEPGGSVLSSVNSSSLNITLNPVKTSDAGQYTCQALVAVESVGVNVEGQNITTLTVQSEIYIVVCVILNFYLRKCSNHGQQFHSPLWKCH